jgi:hypothetical protein
MDQRTKWRRAGETASGTGALLTDADVVSRRKPSSPETRGFSLGVLLELVALKNHFETVTFPRPQTVWDEVAARPSRGA